MLNLIKLWDFNSHRHLLWMPYLLLLLLITSRMITMLANTAKTHAMAMIHAYHIRKLQGPKFVGSLMLCQVYIRTQNQRTPCASFGDTITRGQLGFSSEELSTMSRHTFEVIQAVRTQYCENRVGPPIAQ